MRSRDDDDAYEAADGSRSDAGSSRTDEEKHSRLGSQRSGKSQDLSDPNYASDTSSKNTTTTNPIEYTEQERAELLRRLDSIKDHLLRGGSGGSVVNENQQFLRPSYYYQHPYPEPYPYPAPVHYHQDPYRRPPPVPYPPRPYPGTHYVDIGADIVDQGSFFPPTPSRYSDMPPYSPVSSHQRLYNNSPRGGGYARWPSDVDSEMGGADPRGYVKKAVSVNDDARRCHPLAGGAPFIACHSCFELLCLPKRKLLAQERQQHKLQCGACSEVISFRIVEKKLSVSIEVEDRSTVVAVEEHDFPQRLSISSESLQKKEVKSVRRRAKGSKATEPAASESASLLELFEYSNFFTKQDSVKPESLATETEVSYNGYSNTEISEDSNGREDSNNNNNRPRSRKGSESGSTEVTTRSSTDDQGKLLEVWVNGHLIPEERVSTAEKLAGPVQAGKYWYDYRAGFWGVMGKPCLGIIPPFIEEFSHHPMPDNCGAGNTEVYVNGRELHKRDLELLAGRGLPRDKNRSYILDISGRVVDGESGEELKSLGKLAPTVDKVKHGFGMRVPRSLAS
ncbi:BnaA09g00190D [Brassica napus]|uniref:BnaA09g00190D protein n=1 Tax=Brassica napus TaxID=3708 RepID=A0A078IGH8_BRANA|nr:BnaA09g00190D [Brassica napus]